MPQFDVNNFDWPQLATFFKFGLYKVNQDGTFLYCDDTAKDIFGLPEDDGILSNYSIQDLYVVPGERDHRLAEIKKNSCEPMTDTLSVNIDNENVLLYDMCWCQKDENGNEIFQGMVTKIRASTISPKMFNTFPRGLYEVDSNDNIIRANRKFARILKYHDESQLIGKRFSSFFVEHDIFRNFTEEVERKGSNKRVLTIHDLYGVPMEVEIFSQKIKEFGKARWGMVTDVTKRQRYYNALDSMPTGYFYILHEAIEQCNDRFVKIMGFKNQQDAIGKDIRDYFVERNDWEQYYKTLKQKDAKGGLLQGYPVMVRRANDNKLITLAVDSKIVKDAKNKPIGREGTIRDITEEVELRKRLEVTTTGISNLIHTFLHPAVKFSGNAELLQQMLETLSHSVLPTIDLSENMKILSKQLLNRLQEAREELPKMGKNLNSEFYDKASKEKAEDYYIISDLREKLGTIINTFDYSVRKENSDLLLKSAIRDTALWVLDELKEFNYFSQNRLKSLIKKDFVNFLQRILFTLITKNAKLLHGESEIMKREVEALRNYIGMAKQRSLHFIECSFKKILENNLERFAPLFEEEKIKIYYKKPNGQFKVRVSQNDIDRVICNLLHNAKKYSLPGKERFVKVDLKELGNLNKIECSIENLGIPIKSNEILREKIWEFGFRGEKAYEYDRDGTGVGLADARDVIERHSGTIEISSRPSSDDGDPPSYSVPYFTTVTITLPKYNQK